MTRWLLASGTTRLGQLRSYAWRGGTGPTGADNISPATSWPQRSGLEVVPGSEPAFSTVVTDPGEESVAFVYMLSFFADNNTCLVSDVWRDLEKEVGYPS